jgi:hypothetical protein
LESGILIFLIVVLLFIFKKIENNFILYSMITLPSTIMHELTHLITSLFLNGRPISINIFPKKRITKDRIYYKLGSVTSTNITWYNSLFIGLSPLLLWGLAIYLYNSLDNTNINLENVLKMITIAFLIEGGFPSKEDFLVAFSKAYIYIGIILLTIYIKQDYIFSYIEKNF